MFSLFFIPNHLATARLVWLAVLVGEVELHEPVVVELSGPSPLNCDLAA